MSDSWGRSFGSVAQLYDRYRPPPPPALAGELGDLHGRDVLEIGAGTGLVTRFLLECGARMTIAEPDDQMRAVLVERSPEVTALSNRAEALELADASFDVVVTSSAWHWFHQPDASSEIARVLRDGGLLFVLGNGFDRRHTWLQELVNLRGTSPRPGAGRSAHEAMADLHDPFGDFHSINIPWTWTRRHEELVQLFGTYSGVIVRSAPERERVAQQIRSQLRDHERGQFIDVPMNVRGVRATRRPRL